MLPKRGISLPESSCLESESLRLEPFLKKDPGMADKSCRQRLIDRRESTIEPHMRLGELLLRAKLITEESLAAALGRQSVYGGDLGENLIALGVIERRIIEKYLHRVPQEPKDIASTGIADTELLAIFMKIVYSMRLEKAGQISDAIKLPQHVVMELARMAIERQLLYTLGSLSSDSLLDIRYALTEEGKRWTLDALQRSGYIGPAPVTLAEFVERVSLQKPTNERVTMDQVTKAIRSLTIEQSFVEQAGPALNSGRAILLYGPPGNGKTSVALCFASIYEELIHIPYAIIIEGQIIRFYDPRIHIQGTQPAKKAEEEDPEIVSFKRETYDRRWVSCRRPFVMAGGELTLDMLDLRYDPVGQFYEAPLHMKALGGCFLIDDFGRQMVTPRDLLNRWIVPMESRVDYMKLRTGASFCIPFEEIVIFATNLDPEDLMDPAFLRRLPYKIEVGPPKVDQFRRIFDLECEKRKIVLTDDVFNFIVYLITKEKGMDLAGYQPTFIIDQVEATCRFLTKDPELRSPYIEYAINNLRVRRTPLPRTERVVRPDAPGKRVAMPEPAKLSSQYRPRDPYPEPEQLSTPDPEGYPVSKINPA